MKLNNFIILAGLILTFVMFTSTLPVVSGSDLIYKQNVEINMSLPCVLDGSPCDSDARCNFTSSYPNGSYLAKDEIMTFSLGGDFNTVQTFSLTGNYPSKMSCTQDGVNGTSNFFIKITPSGEELETSGGILHGIALFASILLFILAAYGATKMPWKNKRNMEGEVIGINNLKWIKITFITVSYLILIWISYLLWQLTERYLLMDGANLFFKMSFWFLMSFFFPLIVVFGAIGILTWLSDKKTHKMLTRGIKVR